MDKSTISSVNRTELKYCRLSIKMRGDRLRLQGTLPPKPGSGKDSPYQQTISTGYRADESGLKRAIAAAWCIHSQLETNSFNWTEWSNVKGAPPATIGEWVEAFEKDWHSRKHRQGRTWQVDYGNVFKQLNPYVPLSEFELIRVIRISKPDTRNRVRFYRALQALCKFAKSDIDLSRYKGSYGIKRVEPRNLPSDQEIEGLIDGIESRQWQLTIALLATYGIRTGEVKHVSIDTQSRAEVADGKTGKRTVLAFPLDWVDRWSIAEWKGCHLKRPSEGIPHYGRKRGWPTPYTFRHCYARRLMVDCGMGADLAAALMGHSARIHTEVYRAWVTEADVLNAASKFQHANINSE